MNSKKTSVDENGVLQIKGDVTASDGPINHSGAVRVDGGVLSRSRIDGVGDVTVTGPVDDAAILSSAGSIVLEGTLRGKGGAIVAAHKSVTLRDLQDSTVGAGDDVIVNGTLNRCSVDAGRRILTGEGRSKAAGGSLRAKEAIEISALGSPRQEAMEVVVESPMGWIRASEGIAPGTILRIGKAGLTVRRDKFPCRVVQRNNMIHMEPLSSE